MKEVVKHEAETTTVLVVQYTVTYCTTKLLYCTADFPEQCTIH